MPKDVVESMDIAESIDLFAEQQRIEERAAHATVQRFQRTMQKGREKEREALTPVGTAMTARVLEPMASRLTADLEKLAAGRPVKEGAVLKTLRDVDPRRASLAAIREALNRMSKPTPLTGLAERIGLGVEDEVRMARWEGLNPGQAAAVHDLLKRTSSPRVRRAAMRGYARRWEERVLRDAWTKRRSIHVGLLFIDYLVRLKVVRLTTLPSKSRKVAAKAAHAVMLTKEAEVFAAEITEFAAVRRPLSMPLVVPPVPWGFPEGGGFHFRQYIDHPGLPRQLKPLPLVRRASKEMREALNTADLSTVYAGLNVAQGTAWRINPRVYSVLTRLLEIGEGGPGLATADNGAEPEKIAEDASEVEVRAYKRAVRLYHERLREVRSKRWAQHNTFAVAREFVPRKAIWFAYNLDFRGRAYACSDNLSPQGNDLQRGLLEFAEGDPLTEDGVKWLAIHVANAFGFDKASFADRERWTYEHEAMVLSVAANPLDCAWGAADEKKRWQFLAACYAWADYRENGLGHPCRVPVMLDGSCSGIQHYAALLRDPVCGVAVNLVPGARPGDLYSDVADVLALPPKWTGWAVDRKLTKRPVMVLPYGGTFLSTLKYVREAVDAKLEEGAALPRGVTEDTLKEDTVALAQAVWQAMRKKVTAPLDGMAYVKKIVRHFKKANPEGKFHWVSPCGLPIFTDYRRRSGVRTDGMINGQRVFVEFHTQADATDWARVEMAAPPNFVHSLDASHLLRSLQRCGSEGITKVAIVHDAFGTTPSRTGEFAKVLREEFARLYEVDQFAVLTASLGGEPAEWPKAPPRGALLVGEVASSEYLFA